MLEHASCFLDDSAALFRSGLEDRRESVLADDHVHFAADTGVAQQLLDIEESARLVVDGVLGAAIAEENARDGDLGVLDRQCTVGVVNGERDLSATQGGATGGAGEDDVFHLAAAQALGTLLAHDPRKSVDDVRLARTVGADHTGHARLEVQGRGRGERLEALEGQILKVHGSPLVRRGEGRLGRIGASLSRARTVI